MHKINKGIDTGKIIDRIKFNVAIEIDDEYIAHEYSEGYKPTVNEIIKDALEAIWTSHRFGTSMTATDVRIDEYDSEQEEK